MPDFGYFLSCEEHTPAELVDQARMAERAGFTSLWISDPYHPWSDNQGQSPSEALNEHVLGTAWPEASVRLEMPEEALQIIRQLFTGEQTSHHGKHYTVENARVYTLHDEPVPIDVSAFGPQAAETAARMGDGLITACGPMSSFPENSRRSCRAHTTSSRRPGWSPRTKWPPSYRAATIRRRMARRWPRSSTPDSTPCTSTRSARTSRDSSTSTARRSYRGCAASGTASTGGEEPWNERQTRLDSL